MTLPIGTAEERELIVDAMADAIWNSRQDAPDDDYSLRVHLSRDEARRAAEAALNVSVLQSRIAEVEALLERVAVLEEAGNALVAKLDECEPRIITTFTEGHPCCPYSGPQYRDELNAFRASLTQGGK